MEVEAIKISIKEFKEELYPVYVELFPSYERISLKILKDMVKDGIASFYRFESEGKLVGFTIISEVENNPYILVEYFAILPELQDQGYGTLCALKLKEMYGNFKGLTLEVEEPDDVDELKERRIKFYERLGLRRVNSRFLICGAMFYPYVWEFDGLVADDKNIIDAMFDIYVKTVGQKAVDKHYRIMG